MNKVYLVRYGCYSDQGIAGVFSTEEKAKKYCEIYNALEDGYTDGYWVDERIVDLGEVNSQAKVVTYYVASIYLKDVWNYDRTKIEFKKGELYPDEDEWIEKEIYSKDVIISEKEDYIMVYSIYSKEHAQKVAIEQYQIHTQQKLEESC